MRRLVEISLAVVVAVQLSAWPSGGFAQSLNLGAAGDDPLEIFADNGIEWQQESLVFVARGNARAVRSEVTVHGDELRAYYRENEGGGTDIWRLDALGHVRIIGTDGEAYGEKAVYDVENGILVLNGGDLRLVTPTDLITADKQIEYWEKKQMAVARGNAVAIRETKRLRADVLAAYFRADKKGESKVYRVEAFDNVRVATENEVATSERGVYNVESGIATLIGSVKIVRGPNVLRGCRAEINLNTGISTLHSCDTAGQVKGLLQPGVGKAKTE
jgi:lipopolysaccharide export system protein LptA